MDVGISGQGGALRGLWPAHSITACRHVASFSAPSSVAGSIASKDLMLTASVCCPKGPCTQIVYTLAPKYLYRDYFEAKVYLFGYMDPQGWLQPACFDAGGRGASC